MRRFSRTALSSVGASIVLVAAVFGVPAMASASSPRVTASHSSVVADDSPITTLHLLKGTIAKLAGTPKVGHYLKATDAAWSPEQVQRTYQWLRSGVPITGATTLSHKLAQADAGHTLALRVTGSELGFITVSTVSKSSKLVTGGTLTIAKPVISGAHAVGATLGYATTTVPTVVKLTQQWKRDGHSISHATHPTYVPTKSDAGHKITVVVTASLAGFTTKVVSSSSVTIGKVLTATPIPTITNSSATGPAASEPPMVGDVLAAHAGKWGPSGVALTYQWLMNGVPIPGQTGTMYTVALAAQGHPISVAVTGTKSDYTTITKVSAPITAW